MPPYMCGQGVGSRLRGNDGFTARSKRNGIRRAHRGSGRGRLAQRIDLPGTLGSHTIRKGETAYRLGADIGGTFTDIVLLGPDGEYHTKKVPSTPADYAEGILDGVVQALGERGVDEASVREVIHGTTVASNTVLENKGARTALITTKGFRDVLELRRLRVPHLYSLFYEPPTPLVRRRWRLEVDERVGAAGEVVRPLDEESVYAAVERIRAEGVDSVAVCLLHSYRNGDHERRVGEIVRKELPDLFCCLSVDVLAEIREYERTSTTVVNAYLGPIVQGYLSSLSGKARSAGIIAPLRIMQSNGGVMSLNRAAESPVRIVESGPAAGVVAAQRVGERVGLDNVISFDMGGTTAKASLIEDGSLSWTTEHEIGAGISLSSRPREGRGTRRQGARRRPGGGGRGRWQHRLDRPRRRAPGRPSQRGRGAWPRLLRGRRRPADRHRRQTSCWATSVLRSWPGARCGSGPTCRPGRSRTGSRRRWGPRCWKRHTVYTSSPTSR